MLILIFLGALPITTELHPSPPHKHSPARAKATTLALVATVVLFLLKTVVAVVTGSVGILSECIHSGLDLLSSLVTYFVVRIAVRPADWDHPFGHGKIESISALFEAFLLLVAAGYIIYEGTVRWLDPTHHIHHLGWGLAVTAFSVIANLFVYLQNRKVAHEEESIAIETNAYHFLTDIFSSLAVFVSLGLVQVTGFMFIDPLVGVIIAVYISWVAVAQMKKCIAELSDTTLPETEVKTIGKSIEKHRSKFLNYHDLKTRKAGSLRYVDLHLEICSEQKVFEAHKTCDAIEEDLMKDFKEIQINIHVEPCGNHGPGCSRTCAFYNKPRESIRENVS